MDNLKKMNKLIKQRGAIIAVNKSAVSMRAQKKKNQIKKDISLCVSVLFLNALGNEIIFDVVFVRKKKIKL